MEWHVRPPGASGTWATDELAARARGRLVTLRLEAVHKPLEGLINDVTPTSVALFYDGSMRQIKGSDILAFSASSA
jgi:hypothetical protein